MKKKGNFLGKLVPVVEFPNQKRRKFQLPDIYYRRMHGFQKKNFPFMKEIKRVPERPLRWSIFSLILCFLKQ